MAIKNVQSSTADSQAIQENQRRLDDERRQNNPMSNLSEAERTEMRSFMEQVRSQAEAGTLDAASLAESAPESFKNMVEERGSDLQSEIERMATHKPPQGPPPGPPPEGVEGRPGGPESAYSDDADASVESVNVLNAMEAGIAEADGSTRNVAAKDYDTLFEEFMNELAEEDKSKKIT